MTRKNRKTVFWGLLLLMVSPILTGATLYLQNIVVAESSPLPFTGLVNPSGTDKVEGLDRLAVNLALGQKKITVIPSRLIRDKLLAASPVSAGGLVIVGSYSAVIPAEYLGKNCKTFFKNLLTTLLEAMESRDEWVEITISTLEGIPKNCSGGEYTFTQLSKETKDYSFYYTDPGRSGFDGVIEIGVEKKTVEEVESRVVAAKTAPPELPIHNSPAPYKKALPKEYTIRSGDKVTLYFRKKNIRLEIQGTAYSSGGMGETISVRPSTTNSRFDGTVLNEREVLIEIP